MANFDDDERKTDRQQNSANNFGPLTFSTAAPLSSRPGAAVSSTPDEQTKCLMCNETTFNLNVCLDLFAKHLFEVHRLVIEDVQKISNLPRYLDYWRDRLREDSDCVPSLVLDELATDEPYYVLSTLVPEDAALRHRLRLEATLDQQDVERSDATYSHPCLFCKLIFEGTRHDFLRHLSDQHHLQLGNPQNLVHIDDLIGKIERKLNELKCIYCDKTFPERAILKEHMRKKLHKRINPNNVEYDRFYIVNYLEAGKTWQSIQQEDDRFALSIGSAANNPTNNSDNSNGDEEYSDWREGDDTITCLFCGYRDTHMDAICLHLEADHDFDFAKVTGTFDFYQKIKLVNYLRRQIHRMRCVYCAEEFESEHILQRHLFDEKHCKIPDDLRVFDQPEFYFPTYENDAFLYLIEDAED